ncbi:FecR domain-containing protein [Hyphomonas sp. WL0036]|uniref:FecR family protein n=1 Tax=Hyphomonas sediminis TaxID=2866160 RepID=UPI001C822A84|nr:FecR domain-containing protein [Hyphomonas sediminis]MBY9068119.1 FecR domain-containing protein [Hyphomonas sediminis]
MLSPDMPDLTAEAGAWLAQLETGKLSKEDMAAFREWIQRSPRHYAEIRRLADLSLEVNVLTGMAEPLKEAARRRRVVRQPGQTSRRVSSGWTWGAVGLAGVAALAVALVVRMPAAAPVSDPIYLATLVGQTQDVSLDDGSRVKLNTDSQLEVAFAKERRSVYLEKGEAYFEVAHDAARPFTVYAGDRSITAVGTAFSVRWTDEELIVTVSEGRVAYGNAPGVRKTEAGAPELVPAAASQPSTPRTMLGAGQRLEVIPKSQAEVIERVPANEISRDLAWRSGFLDFENAPLSEVVREMQRYTPQTIEIEGSELADLRFGGVFRIGETDAFFEALELSFGVVVEETPDSRLVLKSAH